VGRVTAGGSILSPVRVITDGGKTIRKCGTVSLTPCLTGDTDGQGESSTSCAENRKGGMLAVPGSEINCQNLLPVGKTRRTIRREETRWLSCGSPMRFPELAKGLTTNWASLKSLIGADRVRNGSKLLKLEGFSLTAKLGRGRRKNPMAAFGKAGYSKKMEHRKGEGKSWRVRGGKWV